MSAEQWKVKYITHNNPDFACSMWAEDEAHANRVAEGLSKLKHVSNIEVVSQGSVLEPCDRRLKDYFKKESDMNTFLIAEKMQTEICTAFYEKRMPRFSHLLGSDWAAGKGFDMESVERYIQYAYERADAKYGEIPYRQRWDEIEGC